MRRNKYGAVKTVVDGITFASKKEAKRYGELRLLERAGEIGPITLQPSFDLAVKGVTVCKYVGDFLYRDRRSDKIVIEDVKGVKTPVYRLKKKLAMACHNITITEV